MDQRVFDEEQKHLTETYDKLVAMNAELEKSIETLANVCPVGDIKGGHGTYPEWLHHKDCLTCFTCYHHCPHHAIEFGRQTQKKGQYFYK